MARQKSPPRLLPSLLDRLIDDDPGVSTEPEWAQVQSIDMLKAAVQRDLEALLNTKQTLDENLEDFPEAESSILSFGLPDNVLNSVAGPDTYDQVRRAVELAIRRFESRLADVRIVVLPPENESDRQIRLQLDARLRVEPTPEPVRFDTVFRQDTGQCQVRSLS